MRKLIPVLLFSCVTLGYAGMASAASLEPADCRPLTPDNARACCTAPNSKTLILSGDVELCRAWSTQTQTLTSPATGLGTPPSSSSSENPPGNPPGSELGVNNGFGNGNQTAPGGSEPNNNAENDPGGRSNPSGSPNSAN
jgi:hypothetical protein